MPRIITIAFILIFLLLIFRLFLFFNFKPHLYSGQKITFTTTLTLDPVQYSRYNMLFANYSNFWSYGKIMVIYTHALKLTSGDKITLSGTLQTKSLSKTSNLLTLYFPKVKVENSGKGSYLSLFSAIRQKLKNIYYKNLSKEYASFLFGVIIGGKENFTKEFKANLQSTGVVHVVSASGFNVTLVAGLLFALTLGVFRRQVAISISILGVLGYMFLAGLQSPVLRAGIMGIFAFSAQLSGRQYSRIYGLMLVVIFLLLYDPGLILDAGFQLTVMATLGIVVIRPLFSKKSVFDDVFIAISAQIAILPITLFTFGTVGVTSIFVNVLVMWTIAPIMIFGSLAIFGGIFPFLGAFFTLLCQPFLWLFIETVNFFGGLGWNLEVSSLPPELIIGYYLIVVSIVYMLSKNKQIK